MEPRESVRYGSRMIRAAWTNETVRVYQAFCPAIADAALDAQRLVHPFSFARYSWIKPSFLWMMYRSDWATARNQTRVLGLDVTHCGFMAALSEACVTTPPRRGEMHQEWQSRLKQTCVRVQWDPDRNIKMDALTRRAIQIGLSRDALKSYATEWIARVEDVTGIAQRIQDLTRRGDWDAANALLPKETVFPIPAGVADTIGADTIEV